MNIGNIDKIIYVILPIVISDIEWVARGSIFKEFISGIKNKKDMISNNKNIKKQIKALLIIVFIPFL
jgi:hypothetical protein